MLRLFPSLALAALFAVPVSAQGEANRPAPLMEPADHAEWLNAAEVRRKFSQDTKGLSRFKVHPAMKIGLMVGADGKVSECLPLAIEKNGPAYGRELCPLLITHADFKPARDAAGDAVRSVFIAYFEEYRPGSAAENRIFG